MITVPVAVAPGIVTVIVIAPVAPGASVPIGHDTVPVAPTAGSVQPLPVVAL